MSIKELMKVGERIFNLKRMYNVKCGISRKDDSLPKRILTEKRGSGGAADNLPPLGSLLNEYYKYRGWDKNGIPTPAKLKELGLGQLAWSEIFDHAYNQFPKFSYAQSKDELIMDSQIA